MIQISVDRDEKHITGMRISGHAGSDEYGKDLVCAGVSAIAFGLLNALDQLADVENLRVDDNLISIQISHPDDRTDLIMKTGLIQFETIAESSKDYIRID